MSHVKGSLGFMLEKFRKAALEAGFSEPELGFFSLDIKSVNFINVQFIGPNPRIEYHSDIRIEHLSACLVEREENLVTAICIAQLLHKGYAPNQITLEKTWKLGHQHKGRLDIMVSKSTGSKASKPWLMIECKTHADHVKFAEKTRTDGSQLFSYWLQDREARYLYLYSVNFDSPNFSFRADYIDVSLLDEGASSVEELHASWDGTFESLGVFHPLAVAYDTEKRLLRLQDLLSLDAESGKGLFNQFAEILRQYSVSDKSNGFNKIFNLFLCKIIDEDTSRGGEALKFQDDGRDDGQRLLQELDELYRTGLDQYLNINVEIDYVAAAQNFAFIDVYDHRSYLRNLKILRSVVRILQPYRIKYSTKHQHLGDFFELLLNEGVKQESGQYFTPVPLTHFAVRSLPTKTLVMQALARGGDGIFPRVIDFACGSGHFVTEAMDVFQKQMSRIDPNVLASSRDRQLWQNLSQGYQWAKGNVYGIEKDYRLAKVTKIATFLNGDGDASILHGDGLDAFNSISFDGLLRTAGALNNVFDAVVANPPYSVSNFMESSGAKSAYFELKRYLKPRGSEIEVLFIERTAQLLRPGGCASLILPAGILTNESNIYAQARRFILANFEIKAVVNLGKDAFMATGIKTVLVFLKKRAQVIPLESIEDIASEELASFLGDEETLVSWMGEGQDEKNFLGYAFSNRRGHEGIQIYERSSLFATPLALKELENLTESPPYLDDLIRASFEKPESLAAYLEEAKKSLLSAPGSIQQDLSPVYIQLRILPTHSLVDISTSAFRFITQASSMDQTTRFDFEAAGISSTSIGELVEKGHLKITSGKRPRGGVAQIRSGVLSLGGEHIEERLGSLDLKKPKFVPMSFLSEPKISDMTIEKGDILICKDGARSGKVAIVENHRSDDNQPVLINEHIYRLRFSDDSAEGSNLGVFFFFFSKEGRAELESAVGGTGAGGISLERLYKVRVPELTDEKLQHFSAKLSDNQLEQGFGFEELIS